MKKITSLFVSLLLAAFSNYQVQCQVPVNDSISLEPGYTDEVYYSLDNGIIQSAVRSNWDIAFYTLSFSAGIRINGGSGVVLYAYPNADTSGWMNVDTSGLSTWPELRNSEAYWEEGAFTQNSLGHPDYGWGIYNMVSHNLTGDSIFIIKLINGIYKKLWIVGKQSLANIYTFRYADLDGSNDTTIVFDCNPYGDRNFIYYSLENNIAINREPAADTWDLLFTKYSATQSQGGYYLVTGVLTNNDVESVRLEGVDPQIIDWSVFSFTDSISNIGYDWKYFDMGSVQYYIVDSMVYFVRDLDGDIYKLVFTGFDMNTGNAYFTKQLLSTAYIDELPSITKLEVYPNPASNNIFLNIDMEMESYVSVKIVDLLGHVIYKNDEIKSNTKQRISTNSWNNGLYLVSVQSDNSMITKKILINRN